MNHHFYYTGQFAEKASVSIRTLRYYDRVGLLSPSEYTEAGYRLYTERDFFRLQQILALKFLGFSLEEIKQCLHVGPTVLQETLALQKAMMQEKKQQLEAVIKAIDETEELLQANEHDWQPIVQVIQVIQMTQSNDWRRKYFTDEQLKQTEALHEQYYTEEQRAKLAEWGKNFTEQDQERASQQWATLTAELQRLVASGQAPTSPEAQKLVAEWQALVQQLTHGDAGITQSLKNMYSDIAKAPAGTAPYAVPYTKEEGAFLQQAMQAYNDNKG